MKLSELRELARQMRLRGTSTMRKPVLVATLQAARSGGQAPAGVTVAAPAVSPSTTSTLPASSRTPDSAPATQQDGGSSMSPSFASADSAPASQGTSKSFRPSAKAQTPAGRASADRPRHVDSNGGGAVESASDDEAFAAPRLRHRDSRRQNQSDPRRHRRTEDAAPVRDLDDILAALPEEDAAENDQQEQRGRDFTRRTRSRGDHDRQGRDHQSGDRRQRRRGRDREMEDEEPVQREDRRGDRREQDSQETPESRVPVAGIVDVLESYAFIRTSGYLPGPNDVYVSMGQVRKYGLRKGDAVQGFIRPPREGDRRGQRQKFVPLQSIETVNGADVEEAAHRPQFSKLTPLYPQERLRMETTPNRITGRLIDIVAPIGKGQRGLIVSPPKAGKTITLQNIANSIATNNPEVHLMVVLVDERPEEVTDMERTVQGEVISSTFDRPASDHTMVAELAIERAKRLVELGQDVVVLLDSMTRLARAYNIAAPASGRILSGGVDAQALYPPKKFFGAARNIENGGSLTIIASALVETGSKMDEVIFEEFKGTGNMELRLSRDLADKRMFPAIDVNASGTRREELITAKAELPVIYRLRRLMGGMEPEQAYQMLVPRLKKTASNHDFLAAIVQQSNLVNG
ncbi:transcription termination factor Rho [uncultured Bifidobacterium sp.]|uniref:transcription termination factor Rho n=1 Tax=uncultured Bifidobacterium sp. TaxID=165187 RepID=UPI0037DC4701